MDALMSIKRLYEKHYKLFYRLGFFVCLILSLSFNKPLTNDTWFMIPHAKDMLANGFHPGYDTFSLHEGLSFVYQKWAMCILTYFIYTLFDKTGIYVGVYVLFFVFNIVLYLTLNKIRPGKCFQNLFWVALASYCVNTYVNFRPHMLAGIMLIILIDSLLDYAYNQKTKQLYVKSFVISLLTMWFHSTMWIFVLVPFMPFLCDISAAGRKVRRKPIVIAMLLSVMAGFLQPNGLYQFKYLLICVQGSNDYKHIDELASIIYDYQSLLRIIILCVFIFSMYYIYRMMSFRGLLWYTGSIFMCLLSGRLIFYAVIFMILAYADDMTHAGKKTEFIWMHIVCAVMIIITSMSSVDTFSKYYTPDYIWDYEAKNCGMYIVDRLAESTDIKNVKLFTTSETGSYSLMYGAKPYYDCRAEVYDKRLNGSLDILGEAVYIYTELEDGTITPEEILRLQDKYGFDYWILTSNMKDSFAAFEAAGYFCNYELDNCDYAVYSNKHSIKILEGLCYIDENKIITRL